MGELFVELVPILATAGLAIASGAGGAALLDLYWKPKRARQRAATLLYAEILQNSQLIRLQADARKKVPRKIPSDFQMCRLGWDTAGDGLTELPTEIIKEVLLLYSRYEHLNECVRQYAEALQQYEAAKPGSERRGKLNKFLNTTVDVFNTGMDAAFDLAMKVLPELIKLGGIKEKPTDPRDYEKDVEQLFAERAKRIAALEAMDER